MGNSIKKAQEGILEFFKGIPYGEFLIVFAPLVLGLVALNSILGMFGVNMPEFIDVLFRIIYFIYIVATVVCIADNKFGIVFVVFGIKALNYLVSMIRYEFYASGVVSLLGYLALAYAVYYVYTQRQRA